MCVCVCVCVSQLILGSLYNGSQYKPGASFLIISTENMNISVIFSNENTFDSYALNHSSKSKQSFNTVFIMNENIISGH